MILVELLFQTVDVHQHLVYFLVLQQNVFIQCFKYLFLFVELTFEYTAELLVKYFVFFHSRNDMVKSFSFSLHFLLSLLNLAHLLYFLIHFLLKALNAWLMSFKPIFHKLNIFFLHTYRWHMLLGFLVHFIVIFS